MPPSPSAVRIYLGLGSNLGDREAALAGALRALGEAGVTPLRVSPVYESAYVGAGSPQPAYLNAVVAARTACAPLELLSRTRAIERAAGRDPASHSRPRPLDIDILLYGGWLVRHPQLVVPHPRLEARRFVLQPLADLGALQARPHLARALAALGDAQPLRRRTDFQLAAGGERADAAA
jgi:2-amino-4-hydroxy-6-hydroxymethyldihydropteridine diphosphokinase